MKKINWPYLLLSYLALLAVGLLDNFRGPIFPNVTLDLGLSDDKASLFFATASIFGLFGSMSAVSIGQWMGTVQGLRFYLVILIGGFFSFSFSSDLWSLIIPSAFFGLAMGGVGVLEHVCIQESCDSSIRRQLFNGLHSFYALAAILAPASANLFILSNLSWRVGVEILCLIPLMVFVYSLFLKNIKFPQVNRKSLRPNKKEWRHMFYLSLVLAFYVGAELTISTRLILYLQRTYSMSAELANMYLLSFFALLLVGRLVMIFADTGRFSSKNIVLLSLAVSNSAFLLGVFGHPWALSLCGLAMAPIYAVMMDFLAETFKEKSSHAISVALTVISVVLMIIHYGLGVLTEKIGINWAMFLGPVFGMISLTLLFFSPRGDEIKKNQQEILG